VWDMGGWSMRSLAAAGKRLSEEQKRKWNLYKRWVKCFNEKREEIVEFLKEKVDREMCIKNIVIEDLQNKGLYIAKCLPFGFFDIWKNYVKYDLDYCCDCFDKICGIQLLVFYGGFQGWFIPKFAHVSPVYPLHTVPLKPFVFLNDIVMPWEVWVVRRNNSVLIDDLLLLRVGVERNDIPEVEKENKVCEYRYARIQLRVYCEKPCKSGIFLHL